MSQSIDDGVSLFGLFGPPGQSFSNMPASQPLTRETFEAGRRALEETRARPRPRDPIVVPPRVFRRMEAIRREFPAATEWQCLEAAQASVDDADAIAAFAELFIRPAAESARR